jgi:hypothetical protein
MKRVFLICIVKTIFAPATVSQSSIKRELFLTEFTMRKRRSLSLLFVLHISALLIMTAESLILPKYPYCKHTVKKTRKTSASFLVD